LSTQQAASSKRQADPAAALSVIAAELREEGTLISEHVVEPRERAALGILVAAGPRCRRAPAEYARVLESVREGYLLHYGAPRVLADLDGDLALLAGDHLYALGLERLAGLADLAAIRELADLIALCAQLHADPPGGCEPASALWLSAAVAIAAGPSAEHEAAKAAVRSGSPTAAEALRREARSEAEAAGLAEVLHGCAEAIESGADDLPSG
jgi:hypothetical protein